MNTTLIALEFLVTAGGCVYLYDKYILPSVREAAKTEVWNLEKSKNKEVLKIQQALSNINDDVETLYSHIDYMDTEVIKKMSLGEANQMASQVSAIINGLNKTQAKVSAKTQANALGPIPNPFKNGFGSNKKELSPIQVHAEKASFHGDNGVNNFLKAVKAQFPNINSKEQFLALTEEQRLNIIRKVKNNNLPIT